MSQWKRRKKYTVELNDNPKENFHFTKFMKRQSKLMVLSIFGVALLLLGSSYAVFSSVSKSKGYQVIKVGTLDIIYTDEGGTINLNGAYPISDEEGMKSTGYKFTIENQGSLAASYKIKIKDDNQAIESLGLSIEELMNHEMLKYSINGESPVVLSSISGNDDIIFQGSLLPGEKKEYEVKLWIKSDATNEVLGKHYHGKIVVEGVQAYNDSTGASIPELVDELIPVTIEENGTVRKADITQEWYNYGKQEWANAVILVDKDTEYNADDIIPENNIESYFVWIPRYKYKIFDEGNYVGSTNSTDSVQTIEIIFENKDALVSSGEKEGEWLTHPAFTSFNSNGMWVGKFETGTTLTSNYNVRNGNVVRIKPNVFSWRNIQVANAFYTSYDYKRNLDSHMMKNTEWGAVAYLQHSIYGSNTEVFSNNNSDYRTGYSANIKPTCGYTGTNEECNRYCNDGSCNSPYNTSVGYHGSTTANISGIYDMSGGAWEYVMGVMLDETGIPFSGRNEQENSGFKGKYSEGESNLLGYDYPPSKYYDSYEYTTLTNDFKTRIMGDATGEVGPFYNETHYGMQRTVSSWYSNYAFNLSHVYHWFLRGGIISNGSYNGIFAFSSMSGANYGSIGFRIVLTPNNETKNR